MGENSDPPISPHYIKSEIGNFPLEFQQEQNPNSILVNLPDKSENLNQNIQNICSVYRETGFYVRIYNKGMQTIDIPIDILIDIRKESLYGNLI